MITTPLPANKTCFEDDPCIFHLTVSDKNAYVTWTVNGYNSPPFPQNRTQITHDHAHGNHSLTIDPAKISDTVVVATTPTNRENKTDASTSNLTVKPREFPPVIGKVYDLICSVKDGCSITIPYTHKGQRKSKLRLSCVFENDDLEMNTYFNIKKRDDRYDLFINHPTYDRRGAYKFTLTNDKGSDHVTVNVTIIDRPSVPRDLNVKNGTLKHNSLVLKWSPPLFLRGSNITRYVIETLDKDGMNSWKKSNQTKNGTQTEIKMTSLEPLDRYRFRVKAENGGGMSDSVETIDIVMKQDPALLTTTTLTSTSTTTSTPLTTTPTKGYR